MKLLNLLNKTIEYGFYLLFILVPLALTGDTSELFEFNKLWVTFIITIVIGAAWGVKMVVKREFRIQRTPLDIPILLFLGSEIVSTIFSIEPHVSLWGYYSRFNGGLFSILSFIFLFYAFVSNFRDFGSEEKEKETSWNSVALFLIAVFVFFGGNLVASLLRNTQSSLPVSMLVSAISVVASFAIFAKAAPHDVIKRVVYFMLSGASLVVLWALPSHFGFDPTCLMFRGTLDVACWTNQFQPKVRLFGTLGQPDWLGAYLAVIVPVALALFIQGFKNIRELSKPEVVRLLSFVVLAGLSYVSILWTGSRGAVIGIWVEFVLFFAYIFWFYIKPKFNLKKLGLDFKLLLSLVVFLFLITFFAGQPFSFLNIFTLNGIQDKISALNNPKSTPAKQTAASAPTGGELGGTDSGKIRLLVWEGAVNIWKHYPVFGSGVETYAFSYYQHRPVAHNLTSEWNYLYNKAHNEFLNYLATTGTVGIATYILMIAAFLLVSLKYLWKNTKKLGKEALLFASFVVAYIGILITNFFGFSVVMINIFFYTIPAFFLVGMGVLNDKHVAVFNFSKDKKDNAYLSNIQKGLALAVVVVGVYLIFVLVRFWQADRYYYLGYNYDQAGDYQTAYSYLLKATEWRPSEPVFRDELSINESILAASIIYQNQQQPNDQSLNAAQQLLKDSVAQSDRLSREHPNNVVFAKTRVRVFYTLSQVDSTYLPKALEAIKKAQKLAPTDADVSYNLGVLTGQNGDIKKAIEILNNTVKLKPDYQNGNAYYALGLFYHQLAIDQNGKVINQDYENKAIEEMNYVIKHFSSNQAAKDALDTWTK